MEKFHPPPKKKTPTTKQTKTKQKQTKQNKINPYVNLFLTISITKKTGPVNETKKYTLFYKCLLYQVWVNTWVSGDGEEHDKMFTKKNTNPTICQ